MSSPNRSKSSVDRDPLGSLGELFKRRNPGLSLKIRRQWQLSLGPRAFDGSFAEPGASGTSTTVAVPLCFGA